jgi:hypothetical protein
MALLAADAANERRNKQTSKPRGSIPHSGYKVVLLMMM